MSPVCDQPQGCSPLNPELEQLWADPAQQPHAQAALALCCVCPPTARDKHMKPKDRGAHCKGKHHPKPKQWHCNSGFCSAEGWWLVNACSTQTAARKPNAGWSSSSSAAQEGVLRRDPWKDNRAGGRVRQRWQCRAVRDSCWQEQCSD